MSKITALKLFIGLNLIGLAQLIGTRIVLWTIRPVIYDWFGFSVTLSAIVYGFLYLNHKNKHSDNYHHNPDYKPKKTISDKVNKPKKHRYEESYKPTTQKSKFWFGSALHSTPSTRVVRGGDNKVVPASDMPIFQRSEGVIR